MRNPPAIFLAGRGLACLLISSFRFGACYTQDMLESLADYQASLSEAVVLVYDPVSTRQGTLSIRALRLSPKAFDFCQMDWSPEM